MDEKHLLQPVDVNGINKISGEFYHLVYHQVYGIRASSLRLTNTYGPRQLIRHNRQGFIGWFVRQVALGEEIQVFGDGSQKRDFNHVDDVVDAFLRAGAMEAANGQVLNLGDEHPVSLLELVELLLDVAGGGSCTLVPFPPERKRIDIGDFYADITKAKTVLGWTPTRPPARGPRPDGRLLPPPPGALPVSAPLAVPFVDFRAHVAAHRRELDEAVARVLDSGWFILGPEGEAFERELAAALGARDAVAVGNGTDALSLALRALGVGPGDEVVTTAVSAAFTGARRACRRARGPSSWTWTRAP